MADLDVWEAVLLGIVQGVTEWLPISSSGHLVIVQEAWGLEVPIAFDLWLHITTLLVVVFHYRARLARMVHAVATWPRHRTFTDERRMATWLVVATIPIVVVGLAMRSSIEGAFSSTRAVGWGLAATTVFLVAAHFGRPRGGFGARHAAWVGLCQAAAVFPGVSRSGATIAGGVLAGMDRREAADFAFLLSIPAILGATVLQAVWVADQGLGADGGAYLAGGLAALLAGYASLRGLLWLLRRWGITVFAPYTAALALWLLLA